MSIQKTTEKENSLHEVNLKNFANKILENKIFIIISIGFCLSIAFVYLKLATPIYEVSTSLLIDASGNNRVLSDQSKYLDGGVRLMETEKNLFNEMAIIKSFSLVRKSVEDLNFNISYFSENLLKVQEHYGYFPFEVTLIENSNQLIDIPFEIEILTTEKFRLTIDTKKFKVLESSNNLIREIKEEFFYSEEFSFGDRIVHDYFSFILKSVNYPVNMDEFLDKRISFKMHNYDDIAKNYQSKLKVDNIDISASILEVKSNGAIVQKEIDFLNKLTNNYIDSKIGLRNEVAIAKESFIRKQLTAASDSLARAEMSLEAFKRNRQAVNLSATTSNALVQVQNLQNAKASTELNLKNYKALVQYLRDSSNSEKLIVPSTIGINDPLLNENLMELSRLYTEKSKKEFYVTRNNQELGLINRQIKTLTDIILANLTNIINSAEMSLRETNMQIANYNSLINSVPTRQKQLYNIERQRTLYENLFNYLSQEMAKAGIVRAENMSDTRVLDPTRLLGNGPVSPKKMLVMVLAFIIGIIIPLTYIVFKSFYDDTITSINHIQQNTNIPIAASITHFNSNSRLSKSNSSNWVVEESFKDLSANLQYLIPNDRNWVIGVTSTVPNEGKTFCSINLGIKFAEAGKKTLIIDADLRNPSLVKEFKGNGLSKYLKGKVNSVNDIIHIHEKLVNLHYIPNQEENSNIHRLLNGKKIQSMVTELKTKYDFIIIDAPAVGLVSDYLLVSNIIDINLFVLRRKVSKISFLDNFEKMSNDEMAKKNSYLVFNDALGKESKYGVYKNYRNSNGALISRHLSVKI